MNRSISVILGFSIGCFRIIPGTQLPVSTSSFGYETSHYPAKKRRFSCSLFTELRRRLAPYISLLIKLNAFLFLCQCLCKN